MSTRRRVFILAAVFCALARISAAEVVFEDNFNSQPDWQPRPSSGGTITCVPGTPCNPLPPQNWNFYRATGAWWGPSAQDTIRITNQAGRGGSGKAFIVYNEANAYADGWGADGQITKYLGKEYKELYLRAWVYYQIGWQWPAARDMLIKTLRLDHWTGSGDPFQNFAGGNNAPIALYYFKHSPTYGTRAYHAFRCEPKATNYMCSPSYECDEYYLPSKGVAPVPTSSGEPADGSWHMIDMHVKINSYSGGVFNSDGVFEFWYDGVLLRSRNDVRWLSDGSDPAIGFNSISLGGNAYNAYSDPVNNAEQWYAVDDVVLSTTPIPANYQITGGATPPAKVGTPTGTRTP